MLTDAKKLSLFGNNLKAMDEIVNKFKMIVNTYIRRGKKNLFAVIEHLRKFSCKTRGVSFCKVATMAEALELSERTVQRIISRLADLGLVKRITMIDEKTGAQWPNCYQLQAEINWNHVVDSLAPDLVAMSEGVPVDPSVTRSDTQDNTPNVTPSTMDKTLLRKPFWALPERGSFLYSFKSFKKNNEMNKDYPIGSFPFYNWLEGEKL